MRRALLAASAAIALVGGAAQATPLDDAKAALAALEKGDNPSAIRLFTSAIESGRLTRSDEELAYVKRAEAYLATSDDIAALADSNRALNLDPRDTEAVATRDRAKSLITAPPPPTAPARPDASVTAMANYDAAMAKYEAQKKADADSYTQQMADYDGKLKAQADKHKADLAAWQADVDACKAGQLGKCGTAEPTSSSLAPTVQAAQVKPAPVPAPKAATQVTAKSAPKPVKKPATPLPPPERPVIY